MLVLRGNEDDVVGVEEDTGAGTDEVDEGPGAVVVCRDALVDVEATTVGWTTTTAVEARTPRKIFSNIFCVHSTAENSHPIPAHVYPGRQQPINVLVSLPTIGRTFQINLTSSKASWAKCIALLTANHLPTIAIYPWSAAANTT